MGEIYQNNTFLNAVLNNNISLWFGPLMLSFAVKELQKLGATVRVSKNVAVVRGKDEGR